jgi:acetyl esterase
MARSLLSQWALRGLLCLVFITVQAEEPTSATSEHLRRWLARFPAADLDGDRILTSSEAWRYQGEGPQRARRAAAERREAAEQATREGRPLPEPPRLQPDRAEVRYGPNERNVLDFWAARSDRPTPLVVFIHGGGWKIGDKREISDATIEACLAAGISVAAVNYRLTATAPFPAPFLDCARALQFLRHHASEWNLDSARVAAYGASAGAGMSLWLAFHDDLADPASDDPIARESTRLTCAGSINGQSTYDPFVIREWIGEPAFRHGFSPAAYGVKDHSELHDSRLQPLFDQMSPIQHLTADDPPVFQSCTEPDTPLPEGATRGQGMHHPIFAHKLKQAMDHLGIQCEYLHVADIPGDPEIDMVTFFRRQFGLP